jgi:hypothetical protein
VAFVRALGKIQGLDKLNIHGTMENIVQHTWRQKWECAFETGLVSLLNWALEISQMRERDMRKSPTRSN